MTIRKFIIASFRAHNRHSNFWEYRVGNAIARPSYLYNTRSQTARWNILLASISNANDSPFSSLYSSLCGCIFARVQNPLSLGQMRSLLTSFPQSMIKYNCLPTCRAFSIFPRNCAKHVCSGWLSTIPIILRSSLLNMELLYSLRQRNSSHFAILKIANAIIR